MQPTAAERRAQIPSWIISTVVHATLVVLILFWAGSAPQGSAEETSRDVGIVLKRATSDGVKFEGEEDNPSDKTADTNTANPTPADPSDALPTVAENSNSADALPAEQAIGAESVPGASASAMANAGGNVGGAPGDVGEEANVEFFGVQGKGNKFVYLVDRSASMDGAPLAAAKSQIATSLASLDEVHQFQIIFFNTAAQPFTIDGRQRIAFASEQNKRMADRLLGGVTAHGGTDRVAALKAAIQLGPDVVFFLTDADGPMSELDLSEIARLNQRYNASICTIEFGRGPDPKRYNFLKSLAESTGGQYGYVNTNTLGK
ncbi:hypothetical protein [Aeoliella sp. SH292]|uniref:hypothetical protein n=1 Tax=Aeoliella sp. SH292 TaxID=3454464 RepID=UPI003F993704